MRRGVGRLLRTVRALPRDARLLLLSSFLSSLPIGLLLVFFPLYLHDLGLRTLLIGGIFTAAGLGSSVLLLAIGPLADRFGRRAFLIAGTALPALGFAIFALTTNTGWLVVASMLGGVGFSGGLGGALTTATFNPLLAGTVPPHQRTTVMSWSEAVWTSATACGALLAGLPGLLVRARLAPAVVADRAVFVGCFLLIVCGALVLLPVRDRSVHGTCEEVTAPVAPPHAMMEWAFLLKLAVFFALQGAGLGLVVQLLPLWFALRFGAASTVIAPWFAVAQLAGLALIPFVPALARRLGVAGVILLAVSVSTLLLVGVPFAPVLPVAGLFYVVRTGVVSMQWPAQLSFLQGAVDPRQRGLATSVSLSCWSIAMAVFPVLAGYFLDRRLLLWPLVLGIVCYAVAAVWFYVTLRRTPLPEETVEPSAVGDATEADRLMALSENVS